ncbi:unnamed protein product [Rangifer tarandus platyrhynchus]|uniref:Uncharacterized protein n=1 Tax=Rangifer tarandus platyrhynchus TaxID=3082113 RepID=A0AC59Z780_RANTA
MPAPRPGRVWDRAARGTRAARSRAGRSGAGRGRCGGLAPPSPAGIRPAALRAPSVPGHRAALPRSAGPPPLFPSTLKSPPTQSGLSPSRAALRVGGGRLPNVLGRRSSLLPDDRQQSCCPDCPFVPAALISDNPFLQTVI